LKYLTTGLVAVALMLASASAALPAPAKGGKVLHATIWPNLVVTFSPTTVKRGTVVIEVKNRTPSAHQFSIAGVTSASVKPNHIISMTVKFTRKAIYTATLPDCGYPNPCDLPPGHTSPGGGIKVT